MSGRRRTRLTGVRRHGYTLLGYLTWNLIWREYVHAWARRVAFGAAVLAVAAAMARLARRTPDEPAR